MTAVRRGGRPPKPDAAAIDPAIRAVAERLLDQATTEIHLNTPEPFHKAVLALRLAEALDVLATEEVNRSRLEQRQRWRDVALAFGTTTQTAHARFSARR